jgi:hypothetical protein
MLGGLAVRHIKYIRSISQASKLQLRPVKCSSPAGAKEFPCSPNPTDSPWGPPDHLFSGYRGLFTGLKRPGCEADRSPPSCAEVKNEWRYTSIPPYMLSCRGRSLYFFSGIHNYQCAVNPLYGSHNYKIICFKVSPLMTDIYIGYIRNFVGRVAQSV